MTLENFLRSLSDLLWSCFWAVVVYKFSKRKKEIISRCNDGINSCKI